MASFAVKIGSHLKELRFHLCLKSASSKGLREFLEQNYVTLKTSNPTFPFLVREASNVQPKVYARYEHGKESSLSLTNMSRDQVEKAIDSLFHKSH
uniref:NADH dehydrogenase [ubiquinone] 1 alpha subcomplex subunit 2 n=1 Tax=Arion vulgaris TaxID=1028688 RepID=A0A0B6YUH0_9EUPU